MKEYIIMKKIFISLVLSTCFIGNVIASQETLESNDIHTVRINVTEIINAYGNAAEKNSLGFVVDREYGYIVTSSAYTASVSRPATYTLGWEGEPEIVAHLIWNDPAYDFAILQADPTKFPEGIKQPTFSTTPQEGDAVQVSGIGGKLSDLFVMSYGAGIPCHYYQITFEAAEEPKTTADVASVTNVTTVANEEEPENETTEAVANDTTVANEEGPENEAPLADAREIELGYPVYNSKGEIIALSYACGDIDALGVWALPISFVQDALLLIRHGKMPIRYSTGTLYQAVYLSDAQAYYGYNCQKMREDLDKIPGSQSRMLQVSDHLSFANPILEVGDIIHRVQGQNIGPNGYFLDRLSNNLSVNALTFTVFQNGKFLDLSVPTVPLEETKCSTILDFGNTLFSTVDLEMSYQTGMPIGSVCVGSISEDSVFGNLPQQNDEDGDLLPPQSLISAIHGKTINSIKDVIDAIPLMIEKKYFNYKVVDYSGTTRPKVLSLTAEYEPEKYSAPVQYVFNKKTHIWDQKKINLQ